MGNFLFENLTQIYFGKGVQKKVGELCKKYCLTDTVMVVSYNNDALVFVVQEIVESIRAAGLNTVLYEGVVPNPKLDLTEEAIRLAKQANVGMTVGVGGGSCIDTAKAIALGTRFDGPLWDIYTGKAQPGEILPVGAVSTLAGTGSETSPFAVLTNTEAVSKIGYGCSAMKPKFALLNPELTYGVPQWQTKCGAFDMFAHILDAYLGRQDDMKLTYRLSESVMKTIIEYLPRVLANPEDYEGRSQLMLAGTLAMGKFASMGLDTNLGFHTMAEDLGAVYDVTHGASLSAIVAAWMTYLKPEKSALLLRYSNEVWGIETDAANPEKTIDDGIRRTKEFFGSVGLPTTLRELGIDFAKDGRMLADRMDKHGDYGDAYIDLSPDQVYRIYEMAQ